MEQIVVIGAGHSGLVAAAYLAKSGFDVTVLESTDTVGGLCQTVEVLPGYWGNQATNTPHNFDPTIVDDLELESHGLDWITLEGPSSMALVDDRRRIISWPDEQMRREEFDAFGQGEAAAHEATLAEMNALGETLDVSFYDPPPHFSELASRVRPGREEDFFARVMFGSAADIATERIRSKGVQSSLAMLAVTGNFIGPSTPGSGYQLIQRPMYRGSRVARNKRRVQLLADFAPRTPVGGMGTLTRSIANAARANGARIILEAGARAICVENGAVTGVVDSDGRTHPATVVLSGINPVTTMVDLCPPEAIDSDLRATLKQLPMSGAMAKVHIGFTGTPRFAAARDDAENAMMLRCGFRCGPDIDSMDDSYNLATHGSWAGEPIIYGLTQTMFDDTLNPQGRHLMSLSVSFAPRDLASGDWATQKLDWAEHVIRSLSQHIPNLPDLIEDYGAITPEDLENRFGLLGGNALHGDVVANRMFNWRPFSGYSDYTTPVEGLYLCSTGTWPANYVSGLSGRNAAMKAIRDLSQAKHAELAPNVR